MKVGDAEVESAHWEAQVVVLANRGRARWYVLEEVDIKISRGILSQTQILLIGRARKLGGQNIMWNESHHVGLIVFELILIDWGPLTILLEIHRSCDRALERFDVVIIRLHIHVVLVLLALIMNYMIVLILVKSLISKLFLLIFFVVTVAKGGGISDTLTKPLPIINSWTNDIHW